MLLSIVGISIYILSGLFWALGSTVVGSCGMLFSFIFTRSLAVLGAQGED